MIRAPDAQLCAVPTRYGKSPFPLRGPHYIQGSPPPPAAAVQKVLDVAIAVSEHTVGTKIIADPENVARNYQARKKNTKINFWGPEAARWGGRLPREGVVVEKFVPSLESVSSLGFEGRTLGCPGILPGCPGFVRIFRSLSSSLKNC